MAAVDKVEVAGDLLEITIDIPFRENGVVYARAVRTLPARDDIRGEIPDKPDAWPEYLAYGLKATEDCAMTLYEIPLILAVGGPGTHELLMEGEWKTQPGGLYYRRELRIGGVAYPNAGGVTAHADRALKCIAEYL